MNELGRRLSVAGLILLGWASARASEGEDVSLSEIVGRLQTRPPERLDLRDRAALWEALVGTPASPLRCGTAVVLALRQARASLPAHLQPAIARLLAVPATGRRVPADGFEVRTASPLPAGTADENGNGLPDPLDFALEETSRALRFWSDAQGWLPPPESGAGRPLIVAVEDLPAGLDGIALPDTEPERTFEEDATSALVVSRRLLEDPRALARALTHQAAHAVLWAYSHREPPAWQEASAVALEVEATRDAGPYLERFSQRLQQRARSLRGDRLGLVQGSGLWALFLDLGRPSGEAGLRRVWEELAAVPGDNLAEAAEAVLAGPGEAGLGEEIATFLAWGLFTGEHDDGRHFPFAASLRGAGPDAAHSEVPAGSPAGDLELEPWSGSVVRLETGAGPGGVRVEFRGGEAGRWSVLALFEGRGDGALRSAWLPVDADGRAEIRFPRRAAGAATLVIVNAASAASARARFGYAAWHDPGYPFELGGMRAEATADGVLLEWTTDGEHDLAGWNVYRSASPAGASVRVNRLPLPAGGDVSEPLHYLFLDSEAERGKRYHYHVEGLTTGGFSESTPSVSVRTPAPSRPR